MWLAEFFFTPIVSSSFPPKKKNPLQVDCCSPPCCRTQTLPRTPVPHAVSLRVPAGQRGVPRVPLQGPLPGGQLPPGHRLRPAGNPLRGRTLSSSAPL